MPRHSGQGRSHSPYVAGLPARDGPAYDAGAPVDVLMVVLGDQPLVAEGAHLLDDRQQRDALAGQLVLDAGRRLRVARPQDDAGELEHVQALGERAGADPGAGVLELGEHAEFVGKCLGDLGARVLRVDGGKRDDGARAWDATTPPPFSTLRRWAFNTSKWSIVEDLSTSRGRARPPASW